MSEVEEIESEIKHLIISYLSNQASEKEKLVLMESLEKFEENRKLFSEYRKLYDLSLCTNYNGKFSEKKLTNWKRLNNKVNSFSEENNHQKIRKLPYYLKIAAAVLLIIFAGTSIFHWLFETNHSQNLGNVEYEVNAPRGGKSELLLADGTKVWLNAGSRLRYRADYGVNNRVVSLDGEGYFSVIKNPEKPFIVQTSGLKIKAFGTSFNVKAYPEEKFVTTTLVEGIVKIEGAGINLSLKPKEVVIVGKNISKYPTRVNNETACKAKNINASPKNASPKSEYKESAIINNVKVSSNVNTNIYTSWKDNLWIIESEPLKNIVVILERKFNVSIDIKSAELNQYTFTGAFNKETLEEILHIIKLTAPLNYQINKGVVIITEEQKRKATYNSFITK